MGSRYARALAEVLFTPGAAVKPEDAVVQLRQLEDLIAGSAELRAILETPAIQNSRKRAVFGKFAEELGVSTTIRNFLFVLLDHRRIAHLAEIRSAFEGLIDEHLGVARADVTSSEPLDQKQTLKLQSDLNQLSGKQVKMKFTVDPSLLGGIMARIGSTLYDGSIRGQLEGMRRRLTSESAEMKAGV